MSGSRTGRLQPTAAYAPLSTSSSRASPDSNDDLTFVQPSGSVWRRAAVLGLAVAATLIALITITNAVDWRADTRHVTTNSFADISRSSCPVCPDAAAECPSSSSSSSSNPLLKALAQAQAQAQVRPDLPKCSPEFAPQVVYQVPPVTVPLAAAGQQPLPRVQHVGSSTLMRSDGVEPGATPRKPLEPMASTDAEHCKQRFPHLDHMSLPVPRWRENVYIAINLHNSAGNGIAQAAANELQRLTYYLAMAAPEGQPARTTPDPSNVFVSIYESGSGDNTPQVLQALGEDLKARNIPAMIVWNGDVKKSDGHHIKNLSNLRNAAMKPLYDNIRLHRKSEGKEGWLADRVLFINDVFWCAEDGLRLLDSGDGGYEMLSVAEREAIEASDIIPDSAAHLRGLQRRAPGQRPHMVCAVDYKDGSAGIGYYDHWVFRDRYGQRVVQRPHPFYRDAFDQAAFSEGRRADVFACWGGMVALDGEMFYKHGLTLRWRTEHCATSECAHLPADIMGVYGDDAWIQQDNMVATTYVDSVRDRFGKHELYDITKRMEHRKAMLAKRAAADISACADAGVHDPTAVPPPNPECPALPYPIALYAGKNVEYPPAHWCCGEFATFPVYWLNCHQVVTMRWADWQKQRMLDADFNSGASLTEHLGQPKIWMFYG